MSSSDSLGRDALDIEYLDNAATTFPKPESVYACADSFYRRYGGNAWRGNNPLAQACSQLISETRRQLADWLGIREPGTVVFSASATLALNLAIFGTCLQPGDAIYVTPFEHNSVLRTVAHLSHTVGAEVIEIPFDRQTYACQLSRLAGVFAARPPRLLCVTQASNVCGVMPPVMEIARLAKKANPDAVVIADGAQVAGLYPLPLNEGLIDAYVLSGHKSFYGPCGIAGIVLASDWRPQPLLFGGTGTFSESVEMPTELPFAYEAGTPNIWAIAGLHASLGWLSETGRERVVQRVVSLALSLRDRLMAIPRIAVHSPAKGAPWCGIVSFSVDGVMPQDMEMALGAKGYAVRAGLHCSPWAHRWLGTLQDGGTIRVSPGWFTSDQAVIDFVDAVLSITEPR